MHMRIIYIVSLAWILLVSSCDSFRDVKGVEDVASMSVAVNIQLDVENLAEIKDLTLNLTIMMKIYICPKNVQSVK